MNNSICTQCEKAYNCPALDDDLILDDITLCVVDCKLFLSSYSTESEDKK